MKNGLFAHIPTVELTRSGSEDPVEEFETSANGVIHVNGSVEPGHRKIDVNGAKNSVTHDGSIFNLAYTILRSCPLGDTIAILIFLLSLPPTLLTLTNGLFAVLTFMPPAGSFSSFPTTFSDVFQGSGGTPSLATIVLTDVIGLILWLVLWAPVQKLALELAQAVVATTLGGGNSSKTGGSDSTLLCMLIVSISHIAHDKWILPKRIFGYEWSFGLFSLPYFSRYPLFNSGNEFGLARSPTSWFRVLIALHILIQGLVHVARRWYTKREYSQTISSSKKTEHEAGGGLQASSENVTTSDISVSSPGAASSELKSKSSIQSLKEPREKVSSGKKKRKQGTFVRSQQPLWAAFAATKVTILREYDQSHALSEAVGSNAVDTKNLGSAPFVLEEGRVWITLVQPTGFYFDTSYFSPKQSNKSGEETLDLPISAGIDRKKPIYVRINGANWASTQIEKLPLENESADWQWSGEVFGLSPASSYNCSFVRSEDDVVIHSTSVSTPSSPAVERESSTLASPSHSSKRPSSPTTPTTTLKNSIAALEASLNESQLQLKRSKKDSKAAIATIKKEIEILHAKISKIGSEDKAHSNRHLQWNQHTRQADEAINLLSTEIEALGCIPENDSQQWKEKKALWDESKEQQSATRDDLIRCKESANREKSAVEAEATMTQQKRERLQIRNAKLNDQHDRLESATIQGLDEKERREAEQAAKAKDRLQMEERSQEHISNLYRSIQDTHNHSQQVWQQAQLIESAFQQQRVGSAGPVGRVTPEGDSSALNPHPPTSNMSGFRFPPFATLDYPTAIHSPLPSLRHETRPRSISILSGNSAYTDFSDQDPAPPMPSSRAIETIRGRQPSGSSGSGSGSVGSQRDQVSPVIGKGTLPRKSPVGKRSSPVWN